jgi:hypothetical protein
MPRSSHAVPVGPATPSTTDAVHVTVEIEALAAPDTLSRLLEPVVMQAVAQSVTAALTADRSIMVVRLDLGADRTTAERLVRKLQGAVTVLSARIVAAPALHAISA